MKSVTYNEHTIIIKNSKFIGLIYSINSKEEVQTYIEKAKQDYPNATHYCYAYILDSDRKESDDGEPSGTAGIPMLQVLEKNDLNRVLCIVIRYFGKIKLGAGGLVRAYTKSVVETLKEHITHLEKAYRVRIEFSFENSKKIDYLLRNTIIEKKEYAKNITYLVSVKEEVFHILKGMNDIQMEIIDTIFL